MYAAEALGKISSEIAIPALIEAIDFEYNLSFGCSPHAAVAPSKINLEVSTPYLVKVLEGNDHMRRQVLLDHSKLKDDRIIQSLINLVKNIQNLNLFSFSYSDQGLFAKTLGEIGGKEVLPYLIESLEYTLCRYKEINNFIQEADQNLNNTQLVEQLKFKQTELDHFFICVAPVIGEIDSEHTVALLMKILQFEDTFAKHFIISTLSKIATPTLLSYLYNLSLRFSDPNEVLSAISNIQARCKYYNYAIYNTHLQEAEDCANPVEKILQEIHQTLKTKTMSETGKYDIKAEVVQIVEKNYGQVIGKNSGQAIGKNYANDPALLQTINEITQVLANLQKTHPTATEAEAKDIIEAEFKEIQNNQPNRWSTFRQQLLNPERWLNGGKATISEIAKHYAENSVFLKAGVAFLDGFSADEE